MAGRAEAALKARPCYVPPTPLPLARRCFPHRPTPNTETPQPSSSPPTQAAPGPSPLGSRSTHPPLPLKSPLPAARRRPGAGLAAGASGSRRLAGRCAGVLCIIACLDVL